MTEQPVSSSRALLGRRSECDALDGLLAQVRAGGSAAIVLRGEAGVGKTALLDYVVAAAGDLRVVRVAGVESEMELPFAALHQMCAPALDRLGRLPGPQRDALGTAFGLRAGPAPDRFLTGLAVLSLLAEGAADRPLVSVIDDAQWLDRASAQVLAFAARRLLAESVLVILATREPDEDLHGLPELVVEGLRRADALELLASAVRWPLDERVAEQIVADTRGNPLALLELPSGVSPGQLAGGFGLPQAMSVAGRIEEIFLQRVGTLPAATRLLLVVTAADPAGDPVLVWRAAGRLGIPATAAAPAAEAGLAEIGARVRFRHPLVRSAVYRSAPLAERQDMHRALADVTDPVADPDRRAWHRAQAAPGPDEDVAAELERAAGRAQARLGRYDRALTAAQDGSQDPDELGLAAWSMVELIEAAARTGQPGLAAGPLRFLMEITSAAGTDWALGIQARSRALLTDGDSAERQYLEAIERLGRTRVRIELARAQLVYGEWLRRENRRVDARAQLRTAHEMFASMRADGFAERARRELLATGETVRRRTVDTRDELTAQEKQVAWRARDGYSNSEIGAELFLSPRTVEWHLRRVFTKLGINSRRQLRAALPDPGHLAPYS